MRFVGKELAYCLLRVAVSALCTGILLCLVTVREAKADTIANGDFETGDLVAWTVFTSGNGTLGAAGFPMVLSLDIAGDGRASKSAAFKVGQRAYQGPDSKPEGGGIYQTVELQAGRVILAVDIAVSYSSSRHVRNLSGGFFELFLDDEPLDQYDFGPIDAGTTRRAKLNGSTQISAGHHTVRLQISRAAVAKVGTPAPIQFVDNVTLQVTPSPAP